MLPDILKRVDAISAVPDAWVVADGVGGVITMGDVRALVQRVRECEAAVADEQRAELIRVASAIYAANYDKMGMTVEQARNEASDLIDECDGFYSDATSDDDDAPEPVA